MATNPYNPHTGMLVLNDSLVNNSQGYWDKYIDTNVYAMLAREWKKTSRS